MNLISSIWIACGAAALVLVADALLARFVAGKGTPGVSTSRIIQFSALLLVVAIGCIILGVYEATH